MRRTTPQKPAKNPSPVDMIARTPEREAELNRDVHAAMTGPAGKEMMAWIRSITTQYVIGPDNDATAFIYQEGMRRLAAMIQQRIDTHERTQKAP